ncbi:inositol monophosphatase family protein [Cellulomonas biazotea]|uniref:Putative monophosphatase n=1 Tax=Cellulomonas biazotea TaxID=1709 RepID=A0A402DTM4_9CELL|nr:inositol monophosphatase family protein [Cellulomonas biazotea]GCE77467.1 putative monophosphatase [Cellulomonas biazotea]
MSPLWADDLRLALELADLADATTLPVFGDERARAAELKRDGTPVTATERALEEQIRGRLAAERPGDTVLGEETGGGGGDRCWVVDPVDGTSGFVRGSAVWATLIGLQVDGAVVVGVVSAPALGRRWYARAGGGAWVREPTADGRKHDRRIHVSGVDRVEDAHVSFSSPWSWAEHGRFHGVIDLARRVRRTRGYGDFYSHVLVAEGVVDISCEAHVAPWDVAALQVVVEEAGGRFTDLEGRRHPAGHDLLVTNGRLHELALDVLDGEEDPLPLAIRRSTPRRGSRTPAGPTPGRP